jgi:Domain of unknown function (DUF4132)
MATDVREPTAEAGARAIPLLENFKRELDAASQRVYFHQADVKTYASVQAILDLPREEQVPIVLALIGRQSEAMWNFGRNASAATVPFSMTHCLAFKDLVNLLLRRTLPFRLDDVEQIVDNVASGTGYYAWQISFGGILRAVENFCETDGMPDSLRPRLEALRDKLLRETTHAEARHAGERLDKLLAPPEEPGLRFEFKSDEAWTRHMRAYLASLEPFARAVWEALLVHCDTAVQSKPSGKWVKQAEALVAAVGPEPFAIGLRDLLARIGEPGTPQERESYGHHYQLDPTQIHDTHSNLLRGLVWCTSLVPDDALTVAVGDAAAICFKKIPMIGPRAPKIGNACLYALSATSTPAAVGQLGRLKSRAKHQSIRKQLAKALDVAADRTGLTAAEMEEAAVPSCGLTEPGVRRQQLGDVTAVLEVLDGKPELTWLRADGKPQKTVPAAVKQDFAADVQVLKQAEKEIAKVLPGQRDRLEQLFLADRTWSYPEFRERYLDHPLVGILARRLIWRFSKGEHACDGIWSGGQIVDVHDRPPAWLGQETRVVPWHPLACRPDDVRAWRDWLDRHQIRQPFKQAHREIYILTDAERDTATYSNRFASHILRQHQFSALCQQRGWLYSLQGNWDSANTPTLRLPGWDLRVEYWVEPVENETEMGHTGIYLYLTTDQVRFFRADAREPMPLTEVPPLVFSEVMRDVDLFVGVAGVGNDPNWIDTPRNDGHRQYWHNVSFGDLSATAETRRAVLEHLLPRLKIAARCTLGDKFLTVKGDLRTYKIHLGSGNILMSPNDQYLCIVPKPNASATGGKVFLPFEGDHQLSVILSKAFLLAEDKKIKDASIVSQIGRG